MKRNRLLYLLLTGILILTGLASRKFSSSLPNFIALYAGDTLWAMMLFTGLGFLFARWSTGKLMVVALLCCYAVETSQLYHAPWIDGIRDTRLGGLILGFGFLWSDILCYTVGVLLAGLFEILSLNRLRIWFTRRGFGIRNDGGNQSSHKS